MDRTRSIALGLCILCFLAGCSEQEHGRAMPVRRPEPPVETEMVEAPPPEGSFPAPEVLAESNTLKRTADVQSAETGAEASDNRDDDARKTIPRTRKSTVTSTRLWQCPKCGKVLEKRGLGKYWNVGDPITRVAGNATCGNCMSRYDQADVYGGMYDIEERAEVAKSTDLGGTVSVIVFQLSSSNPPSDARELCQDLLHKKYPKAQLGEFYCIGRTDQRLTPDEGLVQYKEHVKEGVLPDLGVQFDTLVGKDLIGKDVVVLFFKE